MLLPALGAAKARARTARCLANFQQFAVALQLYAQDHDDHLPPNADGRETAAGGPVGRRLAGPARTGLHEHALPAPKPAGAHLGVEVKIWQCPAARAVTVDGGSSAPERARLARQRL